MKTDQPKTKIPTITKIDSIIRVKTNKWKENCYYTTTLFLKHTICDAI